MTFRFQRIPLERVIAAIWPESGESDRAFHSALYRLRHALREGGENTKFVLLKGGECSLESGRFDIDVDAFENALKDAQRATGEEAVVHYSRAISLYRGDYLENLLYYDWVAAERRRLKGLHLRALQLAAAQQRSCGDYRAAIQLIDRALQVDGLNEQSYQEAMRYCAVAGDKAGLIRRYQQLEQALHDELNVAPSVKTQALYRDLLEQVSLSA
jgi:LuxR family maltose regulon positive regulatory protein